LKGVAAFRFKTGWCVAAPAARKWVSTRIIESSHDEGLLQFFAKRGQNKSFFIGLKGKSLLMFIDGEPQVAGKSETFEKGA
jgi:hypothetical protein